MRAGGMRHGALVALAALLGACGGRVVPPSTPSHSVARKPVAATPIAPVAAAVVQGAPTAAKAGLTAGPAIYSLPITERQASRGLLAFRTSCPSLMRRTDTSGLTRGSDSAAGR